MSAASNQVTILLWVDVFFATFFACVIALGFLNSYLFLYKQQRYKSQPLIVWFYFFAQVACLCRLAAYVLSICGNTLLQDGVDN